MGKADERKPKIYGVYLSMVCSISSRTKTEGNIVNIASISGATYNPQNLLYNISKAGVAMLTKTIARDLGPDGIRVNAVGLVVFQRI